MKRRIFAPVSSAESERERRNRALSRTLCAEGMVLLENNGALPLSGGRAALYGAGVRHTSFGGTGSGETHPRRFVDVETGFRENGWEVTTSLWLDELDAAYAEARARWQGEIAELLKNVPLTEQSEVSWTRPFRAPEGREITAADAAASGTDTAVYVLTRQAGEGRDRRVEEGDYLISPAELGQLRALRALYGRLVLVLNSGGPMDLGFLDELRPDAVLYASQGGMEMGNALFDVLTGAAQPGGRLADTWARRYEDYPGHDSYSHMGGEARVEEYREGIYVGYRWFDSFGIEPRYPFGYGLSYTSFELSCAGLEADGARLKVRARVENRGERPGREVAQLYLSAPEGRLRRERQSLAAFAKTPELQSGAGCELELEFDLRSFAAFDAERGEFVLEPGEYVLRLGRDSRSARPVAVARLREEFVAERVRRLCAPRRPIELLTPPEREAEELPETLQRVELELSGLETLEHDYRGPRMYRSGRVDAIAARLTEPELALLLTGSTYTPPFHSTVFGACGRTSALFLRRGARDLVMADGPQGLNLTREARPSLYTLPAIPESIRKSRAVRLLSAAERALSPRRTYYQFTTAWPCETAVAQTWDTALARAQGEAVSAEMEEYGVDFYLAPAMNIHRNPLCGRNFEYFSEDPLLSGRMAAAVCRGVQSRPGRHATLKHFACNELEDGRKLSDSRLDERALREIYLKGFRLAVTEGGARAVMSSYNLINGVYAPNNRELLTGILRCEWGFEGLVMTDWFATGHSGSRHELCCEAGNDLVMPGTPAAVWDIYRALRRGELSRLTAERAARNILRFALGEA